MFSNRSLASISENVIRTKLSVKLAGNILKLKQCEFNLNLVNGFLEAKHNLLRPISVIWRHQRCTVSWSPKMPPSGWHHCLDSVGQGLHRFTSCFFLGSVNE